MKILFIMLFFSNSLFALQYIYNVRVDNVQVASNVIVPLSSYSETTTKYYGAESSVIPAGDVFWYSSYDKYVKFDDSTDRTDDVIVLNVVQDFSFMCASYSGAYDYHSEDYNFVSCSASCTLCGDTEEDLHQECLALGSFPLQAFVCDLEDPACSFLNLNTGYCDGYCESIGKIYNVLPCQDHLNQHSYSSNL